MVDLKPVYNVCKACFKEGKIFIATECQQRERHMEQVHGMTGDRLKTMIQIPKTDFLALDQQTVKQILEALNVEE